MYQIDFKKPQNIHFIGIGGISMSGLAEILLKEGFSVSGSDSHESGLTERLREKGARIFIGQKASNIGAGTEVAVYTAAIHPDNPEFMEAKARKIPMLSRAELLGEMMRNYRQAVAVSGTHGKTTTTSLLTEILLAQDLDPTVSVGGMLDSIGGNIRIGGPELFVTEACEYTNSFLSFFPTIGIILNVEADHLDFFKDLDEIRDSFRKFASLVPEDGAVIINSDIKNYRELLEGTSCRVITFGKAKDSVYQAEAVSYDGGARPSFDLIRDGENLGRIELGVAGEHNVYNALAAIAAAQQLGVSMEAIRRGLAGFSGPHRRFERKGTVGGVTVMDDYAHHPQEIHATLAAAKRCGYRKLWCVFQPHTYTRTKALMDEFAQSLAEADEVVLAAIYPARETDTLGISSRDLAEKIEKLGTKVHCFDSFDEIETFLLENCVNGDLLITMGAGDIVKVGEKLLGQ